MDSSGHVTWHDTDPDSSITFVSQDGCQSIGIRGGSRGDTFSAYIFGDSIWILSDLTGYGLTYGTCVISGGVMTVSETITDVSGTFTIITTFVSS